MERKVIDPIELSNVLYTVKFIEMKHSGNREWNSECYWNSYNVLIKYLESLGFKERDEMEFMKETNISHVHAIVRIVY
ncbi:hypothetical protein NZZ87_001092 [Staphylococcus pseudintermedius]|nr:hypothetical protein [Staphylococcus pseudintermedius]